MSNSDAMFVGFVAGGGFVYLSVVRRTNLNSQNVNKELLINCVIFF